MDLTDEQWAVLEPLIGELPKRADGQDRPRRGSREVLNGILWILRTGAQWADLPERYPPYQTCHRRFQRSRPRWDVRTDPGGAGARSPRAGQTGPGRMFH
jgi:transposase